MPEPRRRRAREWLRRYLPLEVLGTSAALVGAWSAYQATGSLLVAAVAGTIAEGVGYYALVVVRGIRGHLASSRVARQRHPLVRTGLAAALTLRSLVAEFGPAELVDTTIVRPALMFAAPAVIGGTVIGWLVGKLLADAVFYVIAIVSFELGRRVIVPGIGAGVDMSPADDTRTAELANMAARP